MIRNLSIVVLFIVLCWLVMGMPAIGQVLDGRYACTDDKGAIVYEGPSPVWASAECRDQIIYESKPFVTWHQNIPGEQKRITMLNPTHGVWTWVPPTALENGNILTDLAHFLVYRQPPGGQPAVWAQVDGKAAKLLIPMAPADYGACFWFVAVRKPATSPAVASDKSNTICLGATGLPLPGA